MSFGKNTPAGFVPSEPSIDSLLQQMATGGDGWSGMHRLTEAGRELAARQQKAGNELLNDYAQLAKNPVGKRILEDLMNMTLRRAPCGSGAELTSLDKQTLHMTERHGQNCVMVYIMKMITDGLALAAKDDD